MGAIRPKLLLAAAFAGLAAAVLAGSGAAGETGAVRATLVTSSQPTALGVFTGSVSGTTLTWRLTHHGAGPVRKATLRIGSRTYPLCAPCGASVTGKVVLTAAAARAARSGSASVDLIGARGTIKGKLASGTVPTIQLVGVADGATLHLPAVVHFAVTGFKVAAGAGTVVADSGTTPIALQPGPDGQSVTLPDDKMLTGRRDLTFSLASANGQPLSNVEATARVYRVLLAGRR